MKFLRGTTLGLAGAAALFLSVGALARVVPASAAPPIDPTTHSRVPGVDGSQMSESQMNLSMDDAVRVMSQLAPATMTMQGGSSTSGMVAAFRIENSRRHYVQISGQYCTNKSGGHVFIADGASVEQGLTC